MVNVRDATWLNSDEFGSGCIFDGPAAWFKQVGINISVLMPGEPNCLYHSESQQEDFSCCSARPSCSSRARSGRSGNGISSIRPAGTVHVFVGAGDGPCAILMVGARTQDEQLLYPVSELAARYGASAEEETSSGEEAYARFERPRRERPPYFDQLPWA